MPDATFFSATRDPIHTQVPAGTTVMRAGVANNVPGIIGECGGQAMCGTCHVYVHETYLSVLPPIGEEEEEMLDFAIKERDEVRSRLGCQLTLGEGLERIDVDVPPSNLS